VDEGRVEMTHLYVRSALPRPLSFLLFALFLRVSRKGRVPTATLSVAWGSLCECD
jgi:hypothetical protein